MLPGTTVLAKNMPNCTLGATATATATDIEKNVARWQRSRALYTHDLQMATLEQKSTSLSVARLELADNLTDADLYVAYAQADRLALNDPKKADDNMQQALGLLDKAYQLASDKEKARIANARKLLLSTRDSIGACSGTNDSEMRDAFDNLRNAIGTVVKDIGRA
jgi:hypothetical protein